MLDIDVEADLNSVNDQIGKLVEEVNKINQARETLIQQLQNLNGVAMYLRGKLAPDSSVDAESVERSVGIPEETS